MVLPFGHLSVVVVCSDSCEGIPPSPPHDGWMAAFSQHVNNDEWQYFYLQLKRGHIMHNINAMKDLPDTRHPNIILTEKIHCLIHAYRIAFTCTCCVFVVVLEIILLLANVWQQED